MAGRHVLERRLKQAALRTRTQHILLGANGLKVFELARHGTVEARDAHFVTALQVLANVLTQEAEDAAVRAGRAVRFRLRARHQKETIFPRGHFVVGVPRDIERARDCVVVLLDFGPRAREQLDLDADGTTPQSKEDVWGYGSGVVAATNPCYGDVVLAEYTHPCNEVDSTSSHPLYERMVAALGFVPPQHHGRCRL